MNFTKKFLGYSAENITAMAFGILGTSLIAHKFGPLYLGEFTHAQAVSNLFIFIASLGVEYGIVREIAKKPERLSYINKAGTTLILGWLVYFVVCITVAVSLRSSQREVTITALVCVSTFFLRCTTMKFYFQAVEKPEWIGLAAVSSRSLALLYLLQAVRSDQSYLTVILYLPIQACTQALVLWVSYRVARTKKPTADHNEVGDIRKLIKESIPMALAAAIFPLYNQLDIILISTRHGSEEAGIYGAAARLIPQAVFMGHVVSMMIYPRLARLHGQQKDAFTELLSAAGLCLATIAISAFILGQVFAEYIFEILYGPQFSASVGYFRVLLLVWLFQIPATLYSRVLVINSSGKIELYKALCAAAFCVLSNSLLTWRYGAVMAAPICVITFALADFLLYAAFKETRPLFFHMLRSYYDIALRPVQSLRSIAVAVKNS